MKLQIAPRPYVVLGALLALIAASFGRLGEAAQERPADGQVQPLMSLIGQSRANIPERIVRLSGCQVVGGESCVLLSVCSIN